MRMLEAYISRAQQHADEWQNAEQLDALLQILYDSELTAPEVTALRDVLFPDKDYRPNKVSNTVLVTVDFVAKYGEMRSLGLSSKEAAYELNITPERMKELLKGQGLTDTQHEMLLMAELGAKGRFKYKHLKHLSEAGAYDWRASAALLEKVLPNEYGKQVKQVENVDDAMSAEDCESKALRAKQELEALRAQRRNTDDE